MNLNFKDFRIIEKDDIVLISDDPVVAIYGNTHGIDPFDCVD